MSPERRRLTPDELLRSKVRANIKRSLRRLWLGDMEFEELLDAVQPTAEGVQKAAEALSADGHAVTLDAAAVAAEMQMPQEAVVALAAEMGLGERPEPDCYMPTPEEIRMETARFRADWSQAERDARVQGPLFGRME